ncbi:MAG: transposase [Verrucomicrobiales bacterium]|nr:transposase [Verrucomicrobiales bacterium]
MNFLAQFWHAVAKVFNLPRRLRGLTDHRQDPRIPPPVLWTTLLLGAVLRVPSFLQLQKETTRRRLQRLLAWSRRLSDDALAYGTEQADLAELRGLLVSVNRTLKQNKAFEAAKINGLLVVALDANEQFSSRARCCAECCQRQVKVTSASGAVEEITEYYHRQVYAQLHGPHFSVILDLEPIRPGEEEAQAALRLLGRLRRLYGPRFFAAITVDAWYTKGPFLLAVQKLGWGVVTVLKQERFEVYQESEALRGEHPPQRWSWEDRSVAAWEVNDLTFTETRGPVRVVVAEEDWAEVKRVGGRPQVQAKHAAWRWLATEELAGYPLQTIWRIGHQRWGVENHAFNELTQYYHLEHCPHHEPVAILAWLLILVLGFGLFEWFVRIHGKLWRQGEVTLQELAKRLDRALERWEELEPLWSG